MNQPTVGSLFSGIGGFELGMERAGFQVAWQVEIEDRHRDRLAKRWPDVRRHDDVRTFPPTDPDEWQCDVICGGFPCQDISKAGNVQGERRGLDGERSGLWSEFRRIVRAVRPRFVVVENVPRLLVSGLGRVLGDLAEIGMAAEWHCLPACAVGAPHIRDRVFVLAYSECERFWGKGHPTVIGSSEGLQRAASQWGWLWTHPRAVGAGYGVGSNWHNHPWQSEPELGRVVDGFPGQLDRLRGLGNAIVPQVAEWIARQLMNAVTW